MCRPILAGAVLGLAALSLGACSGEDQAPPPPKAAPASAASLAADPEAVRRRRLEPAAATRGAELYTAHCAACHGARAEGAPNWHKPGLDGKYPPPPLDGSAHDWHHPRAALRYTIKEGTARLGGNMPAWKDKLTDADVEAIIDWIVAHWPDEVYAAWLEIERKSTRP